MTARARPETDTPARAWVGTDAGARAWAGTDAGGQMRVGTDAGGRAWVGTDAGGRAWAGTDAGGQMRVGTDAGGRAWAGTDAGGRVGVRVGVGGWVGADARRRVAGAVVAGLLAAVAGAAFVPLVRPGALAVVPFAAVLPVSVAVVVRRGALLAALAGWPTAGVPVALAFGTGPAGVAEVLRGGAVDGFRTALTAAPPLTAGAAVLFWLFTLVWWAAYWGARAAWTGAAPPLALVPGGLVLLTGVSLGAAVPGGRPPVAPLFAGLGLVLLMVLCGAGLRRALAAVVSCVAVVVGALATAPLLPYDGHRPVFDPRALAGSPVRSERQLSPFALAELWVTEPPRPLFQVVGDVPVNQRLAVFDRYDGLDWASGASYVPTAPRLPGTADGATRAVRERVIVGTLPLSWLPAPDRPVEITGTPARVDRATGVLITADGRAATGRSYTVTARVPELTVARAAAAVPAYGPGFGPELAVPSSVPLSLLTAADRATAAETRPYGRLLALQNLLLTRYRYDVLAAPGRTAGHLAFFFDQSHEGTADQFATVFALMARHLGFPARVAVGFAPGASAGTGRYQVSTTDVVVWAEVALRGLGWVPFYPVPRPSGGGGTTAVRPVGEPAARAGLDEAVVRARPAPATGRPARNGRARPSGDRSGGYGAYVLPLAGGLALLLAALALSGPVAAARIRRRRRSGTPAERVSGAWRDAVGTLHRLPGAGPPAGLTAEEVAAFGGGRLGADAGEELADLAGRLSAAVFSPHPVGAESAAAAWLIAGRLRGRVRRELPVWRRLTGPRPWR